MPGGADRPQSVHGTAIAMGGKAVLLRGSPGAGKSDLALRCLALGPSVLFPEPVWLVSDDWVIIERSGEVLQASAPKSILGLIEVRGLGIVPVPTQALAHLVLVADLVDRDQPIERLPDPTVIEFEGIAIPVVKVHSFEASAAVKVLMALRAIGGSSDAD